MKDSRKLMIVGVVLLLTATLFSVTAELVTMLVRRIYQYQSKPSIQLVAPPVAPKPHRPPWEFPHDGSSLAPACKVCHCGQVSCHRDCGEQNMCNLKCEGLCQKQK